MRPPVFLIKLLAARHRAKIDTLGSKAYETQEKTFKEIVDHFSRTEHGKHYGLDKISTVKEFDAKVPVTVDTDYNPFIEKVKRENLPGRFQDKKLSYLAKTSGSTAQSKYIPYTWALIKHFKKFSFNLMLNFCHSLNDFEMFKSHILVSPSNPVTEENDQGITIGYAAGIMTLLAPKFSKKIVRPTERILKINSSHEKIEEMIKEAFDLDIRFFSSVPAFAIPILEQLYVEAKRRGKAAKNIYDIWPNFKMYVFSGSALDSYENKLRSLLGEQVPIMEVYSATESPIAYQYGRNRGELYLDLESCFFQFQPSGSDLDSPRLTVNDVEVGQPYRILLTTRGGLFCYRIGDLVEFLSLNPPLIKVVGREKEELNMAGTERLSLPMLREFLEQTLKFLNLDLSNFFICPNIEGDEKSYHWCFEVDLSNETVLATDWSAVLEKLDSELIKYNSGYKLSRDSNTRLYKPKLSLIPSGTIENYLLNNKQFGQGKFLTVHNSNSESDKFFDFVSSQGISCKSYKF